MAVTGRDIRRVNKVREIRKLMRPDAQSVLLMERSIASFALNHHSFDDAAEAINVRLRWEAIAVHLHRVPSAEEIHRLK